MPGEEKGYIVHLPTETEWLTKGEAVQKSSVSLKGYNLRPGWRDFLADKLDKWQKKHNSPGEGPTDFGLAYEILDTREGLFGTDFVGDYDIEDAIKRKLREVRIEVSPARVKAIKKFMMVVLEPSSMTMHITEFKSGKDFPDRE